METKTVLDFIDAINSANIAKMHDLMTIDHVFVDSQDNRTTSREVMKQAWIGYFALFPDYKIEIKEMLKNDHLVCLLGYASATYMNLKNEHNTNYWRIPAAWTAIVKDNHISHWQVYADNIVVMDIINKNK